MEVGAVKQDFNTEIILLKKNLNQAKIQIIHKLTRKAKQLTEKKAPEQLQEKLKRKAESAVKEVLIIKKIKPKDLIKFIVTHKGELNTFLNKPQVDEDKACARLLLHKALQDKYKSIRGRFSNVTIQDLFMSRLERRKMKKEAIEKQKNKKKAKNNKIKNSEGDWNVEDIAMGDVSKVSEGGEDDENSGNEDSGNEMSGDENEVSGDEREQSEEDNKANEVSDDEREQSEEDDKANEDSGGDESEQSEENDEANEDSCPEDVEKPSYTALESSDEEKEDVSDMAKGSAEVKPTVADTKSPAPKAKPSVATSKPDVVNIKIAPREIIKKNPVKKQKELNKTKQFKEKILQKKFKKDSDVPVVENKIVDSFFMKATGEKYISVVEPRAPDEIKDEHMGANRKLRRAVQFGLVPKSSLRQNNNYHKDGRFNRQNGYDRGNNYKAKFNDRQSDRRNFNGKFNDRQPSNRRNFNDKNSFNNDFNDKRGFNNGNDKNNEEPEKLHPSWEAKKKKSAILPFQGKKIVFDES